MKKKTRKVFLFVVCIFSFIGLFFFLLTFLPISKRTEQAEMRILLVSLFEAETAFRKEHGFYTTDIFGAGFRPQRLRGRYLIGFVRGSTLVAEHLKLGLNPDARTTPSRFSQSDTPDPVAALNKIDFDKIGESICPDCTAERDRFKAIAIGRRYPGAELDIWTLDEANVMNNVQYGSMTLSDFEYAFYYLKSLLD